MKKILTLMLSLVLLVGSTLTVNATDLTKDNTTATAEVVHYVDSSYIVTIPEKLYLSEEYAFEALYMNIQENEIVNLYITNLIDDSMLEMTNASGATEYMTLYGVEQYGRCAYFTKESTVSGMKIYGTMSDTIEAGEYTGIAEFRIDLGVQ